MKAIRLYGKEKLRVDEIPVPKIQEDEILLKTASACVCGTDVRMYSHGHPRATEEHPLITGHELSGIIETVGKKTTGFQEGTRIAVAPNYGCGTCNRCIRGLTHLCAHYRALGISDDGGFAEYVRIPAAAIRQGNIVHLPDQVSFEDAALMEPFSCVYSCFESCHKGAGESVLIMGSGPIAIMHARMHRLAGASQIFISGRNENKLKEIQRLEPGVITLMSDKVRETVMTHTQGEGVDVCITACASPEAQQEAIELAAMNGRVSFFGGLPAHLEKVPLNTNLIHYRQIVVSGTTRQSLAQYRAVLSLLERQQIRLSDLITHRYDMNTFSNSYLAMREGIGFKHLLDLKLSI